MKISALKIVEAVLDLPANQHRLNLTRLTVLITYVAGKSKTQSCLSFLVDKGQLMSNFTMITYEQNENILLRVLYCHCVENLLELLDYNLSHTLAWHLAMINPDFEIEQYFPGVVRPTGIQMVKIVFKRAFSPVLTCEFLEKSCKSYVF